MVYFVYLIGKNVVYLQLWFIRFVKDIVNKVNGSDKLCAYNELCYKYNAYLGQMSYNSLIKANLKPWLNILHSANTDLVPEPFQFKVDKIIRLDQFTNVIYQELLKTVTEGPNKTIETWSERLDINKEDLFKLFTYKTILQMPENHFFNLNFSIIRFIQILYYTN